MKQTKKNKGGRPTKYKPEYCQDMIDYFRNHSGFPTFEHFAVEGCDVHPETLINWAESHEDFFEATKKAKAIQKHRLCEGAFSGELNPTFSIFFAKNNCGMVDKQEVKADLQLGGPILTNIIETKKGDNEDYEMV